MQASLRRWSGPGQRRPGPRGSPRICAATPVRSGAARRWAPWGRAAAHAQGAHGLIPVRMVTRRRQRDGAAAQLARAGVRAASPHPRVGAVSATPGTTGAQAREAPCPEGGRARKNRVEGR